MNGRQLQQSSIQPGSTIGYFDTRTLYAGQYVVVLKMAGQVVGSSLVVLQK